MRWRAFAGVLLALLVGEAWKRQVGDFRYAWDPDLGEIFEPGSHFVNWGEGKGSGTHFAHGFRVSHPDRASDSTRIPVLVLGDSFAEALQVSDEELFSNLLGKQLEEDGLRVQVANAGRAAYSMADYVCRSQVFDRILQPAWVVVQLNDADFSGDAFTPQNGFARFQRSGAHLECVEPTIPPPPPSRGPIRSIAHEVRNRFSLPDALWSSLRARVAADEKGTPLFSAGQVPPSNESPGASSDGPIEEELRLLGSAWGPRLTLLYLPSFEPSALTRAGRIEGRVSAAAKVLGIRFRSLREEFPDLAQRRIVPYGFSNTRLNAGHWNADGHAAAARILRREFLDLRAHGLL